MTKLKNLLLIICIFLSTFIFAQNETSNWYFGENAGLNFNNINPNLLGNGEMDTPAGCASISTRWGDLMFYTNGQTVWNKNHDIMETGLPGDPENAQSSIIIPNPSNPNINYIFTTRETLSTTPLSYPGLYVSTVEFSTSNPLGEVTTKSHRLKSFTTQRLTAIHSPDLNSFKVIAFGSASGNESDSLDTFFVYNVTASGVEYTPIESKVSIPINSSQGNIKFSPDGTLIAIADYDGIVHLYNFNSTNSEITYKKSINPSLGPGHHPNPYGVEFSQDSKILYFTANIPNTSYLYKYVIDSTTPLYQREVVDFTSTTNYGDLQLASNGKIYIANYNTGNPITSSSSISVINTPEDEDAANFTPLSLGLRSSGSYKGLPNFVSSFLRNRIVMGDHCLGETVQFTTDTYMPVDYITWEFGDGQVSTDLTPFHKYSRTGKYTVKVVITYNGGEYFLQKEVEVYGLPEMNVNETLFQCDTDNDGISIFNLNNIQDKIINYRSTFQLRFYNTEQNAVDEINDIPNPENYTNSSNPEELYVKIINEEGCSIIRPFNIESTFTNLPVIAPIYTCEDSDGIENNAIGTFNIGVKGSELRAELGITPSDNVYFYPSQQDAQLKTNVLARYYDSPSTDIWVRIETEDDDCSGIGSFKAIVNSSIALDIEDEYELCYNLNSIALDGGITNNTWEWKDVSTGRIISTRRSFSINTPGSYSVTVSKTENGIKCELTKNFIVKYPGAISFQNISTDNNQIEVSVQGNSVYEFSIDDINYYGRGNTYTFTDVRGGNYTVYVRDINGCEAPIEQEVALIEYPKFFTPNNDGYNDFWQIKGVSASLYKSANIYIFDRYGKLLYQMDLLANIDGWDGLINGNVLPTSDYWFQSVIIDNSNRSFSKSGHFTLKR